MSKQDAVLQEIPCLQRRRQGVLSTMQMFPTQKIVAWGNMYCQKIEKEISRLQSYFGIERTLR